MLLNATDASILTILEKGRITNSELAHRIGLSAAATLARVGKLESAGFICGYTAILDRPGLGLPITAFVSVILRSHGRQESADFLEAVKGTAASDGVPPHRRR